MVRHQDQQSLVVVEMLKASGYTCIDTVTDLVNAIIHGGKLSSDWHISLIANSFKGKDKVIEHGNYRGLKLIEQVMKVKHCKQAYTSLGLQGYETTDAVSVVRQLQEKFMAKRKKLFHIC